MRLGLRLLLSPCLGRQATRFLPFALHEASAERAFGRVLVMGATTESDAIHARLPATRDRGDVVKFQPRTRFVAFPAIAHERAPAAIALPDRAPDCGRDVPDVAGFS